MMLAASDLLRGDLDPSVAVLVRSVLERAASGTAQLANALRALGAEGENLAQELEAAVRATSDAIAARLPSARG